MPRSSRWVSHRTPSKIKKLILFLLVAFVFYLYRYPSSPSTVEQSSSSIYNISVKDIEGKDVSLSKFTGKVLLIVNVASKCGLTHGNYKEMNILYAKYKTQGFEILAFPCNQFGSQEPGSNMEIKETVCNIFKAEFPIFDKIEVNGKNTSPLYNFLKEQKGGLFGDAIKWNFAKFLVDRQGNVVDRYAPTTSPLEIEKDIVKLLASA
ncbi:Glutathione peroxidase [Arabidopsis thaliana x Arabidopsis arenosa]|uniref:Glutathione peroxidase n=1 Tax=Arabidopsis thaliana x Arabidopsis arenosa TaxID=1240361 RepID=A0A8T2A9V9_9BRAS|nr:Glutathione peroxidase [Arabidopsis thaliana x Arabidopsis arenosa]